jgi:glucose-6-phosphate 1-dehydrogenase
MASQPEQTLLILGATGDLAGRLLLPGLGALLAGGGGEGVSLLGSAGTDWDDQRWRKRVAESFTAGGGTGEQPDAVARSARYPRRTPPPRATGGGCLTPATAVRSSTSSCRRR